MMLGKNIGTDETWKRIPKNSIGIELGVWKGDSSEKFLKHARHVHLVDSWSPIPYESSDEHGDYEQYLNRYEKLVGSKDPKAFQEFYDNIYQSVVERFKNAPITIHRMSTAEFFSSFSEKVDWVYVDADHSYAGCLKDLENSFKVIKPGGYIFGDDYTNKPGVRMAVDDFVRVSGFKFTNFHTNQFEICIPRV